jgi:bifunctional non-homologous end joining protein LigD
VIEGDFLNEVDLMLATLVDAPFDDPDWLFETKWDGVRALCLVDSSRQITLRSRNGKDLLKKYPNLARIGQAFRSVPAVIDGEIVSLDPRGKSSFQRLQNLIERQDGAPRGGERSIKYVAFDLLVIGNRDVRGKDLERRKAMLAALIIPAAGVVYSRHVFGQGKKLFSAATRKQLEGVIGKRRSSTYIGGRSRDWIKIKVVHEQEFVIGGWSEPRGSRHGFGSLLLGVYDGGRLHYVGPVGTGFDTTSLRHIARLLRVLEIAKSPFTTMPCSHAPTHFVSPKLVAEVKFGEWTKDGLLRQPVFLRLRDDKRPRDVIRSSIRPHRGELCTDVRTPDGF